MTADLCVLDHDGDDAEALPTLRLCRGHRDGLRRDLERLPGLHARLATALATGGTANGTGRVTGSSSEPLPINPAVADLRDQIRHDLVWWVLDVARARGLTGLPHDTVAACAEWLLRQVDWISSQRDTAETAPGVFRDLAGKANAMLDPNRRLATGERCRIVPDGAERCSGVVSMVQGHDETWTARCSVCGRQEAAPYLRDRVAGRWVTVERVQAYALRTHGVRAEKVTIRSWAARGRVQTQSDGDRTWYELGSVQRYLTERERMAG